MAKCPACGNQITKNKAGQRGCKRHGPIFSLADLRTRQQEQSNASH